MTDIQRAIDTLRYASDEEAAQIVAAAIREFADRGRPLTLALLGLPEGQGAISWQIDETIAQLEDLADLEADIAATRDDELCEARTFGITARD